ncbi:hypothetical protein niasHT_036750 [Heterodera trifolii]|uniref:Uncharacterized protein n=1 Tax=Heterodera trifolii TaxID=157864 RepID=A0ABD2IXB7_9BILA
MCSFKCRVGQQDNPSLDMLKSPCTQGKCWHGQSPGDTEGSVIPSLWRTVGLVSIPVDILPPPAPFIRPSVRSNDRSLSVREDKQTDGEKRHLINGPIPYLSRVLFGFNFPKVSCGEFSAKMRRRQLALPNVPL